MSTVPVSPYAAPSAELADAVEEGFADDAPKFFSAQGRIGRWYFVAYAMGLPMLIVVAAAVLCGVLTLMGKPGIVLGVAAFAVVYVAIFAAQVMAHIRRFHDIGMSGWWYLLMLVPVANLIMILMLLFKSGAPESNLYGPRPRPATSGVKLLAASLVLGIALIGILAAIAIPAYQNYVIRAKAAQVQAIEQPAN